MEGGFYKYSIKKYIIDGKVLAHLGFQSNVLAGPLTDWSASVSFCTSSPQQGVKYQLWYLNFVLWRRVSINIPWKLYKRRQSSCALGVKIKGIARAFHWLNCLGGFLHLKPTAGCQISTLIFEFIFVYGGGSLWISYEKYIKDGKVLAHLGLQSKVLTGPLTDWSAWVGFFTSSPQ